MVDLASFEPVEVPEGIHATVLVSAKVGLSVCIPLHSLPHRAARELLHTFMPYPNSPRALWHAMRSAEPFGRMVYVVGAGAARAMRETLGGKWPAEVEVVHLHG